jgi:ABC-2 type transport system ATP-binding protein
MPPDGDDAARATTPSIRIRGLVKRFGDVVALRGLDLDVHPGEIFGYVGRNGAGKTTTIRILCGMLDGFDGRVAVCGHDVAAEPLAVKRRIGYVPETAALYDELTAAEFLRFVGMLHDLGDEEGTRRTHALLECFGLAAEADDRLATYSKGMRQKVLLAAALLPDPDVLVLDEPLSGLDAHTVVVVKEILTQLAQAGKTIFYSSHVLDVVERVCDRIALVDRGVIVASGTFDELQARARGGSLERIVTELTSTDDHAAIATRIVAAVRGAPGPRA